ncbi:DinB family protein [Ramlibacter sp. AN1015]|uniref:DinB family protein n=1 Tax=Ramlibacter sp. AN1015 TaxID=3133428 RepID=UPI0030C00FF9
MDLSTYFQQLAHYHVWATERLLGPQLRALPEASLRGDAGLFFGSIHGTLNHLLVAERLWQARVMDGCSPRIALNAELVAGRDALADALQEAARRWSTWLAATPPQQLAGTLTYTRNNGQAVVVPLAGTLGHVFNHATHHRGQITAALTAQGREAPELDWIILMQEQQARSRAEPPRSVHETS